MDRELFKKAMDFQMSSQGKANELTPEQEQEIILASIVGCDEHRPGRFSGYHNTIIVNEELAELMQELSKALRGKADGIGILEELADVSIGIDYIKEIFDISDEQLQQARNIKLNRLKANLAKDGFN